MNILWILEDNNKSASFKIAVRLAKVMSEKHHTVCVVYAGNVSQKNDELNSIFEEVMYIGSIKSKRFADLNRDMHWKEKTSRDKAKYAFGHPLIGYELLKRKMSRGIRRSSHQLDEICKKKDIDVVIGEVFPVQIAEIMACAGNHAKKVIIQLDPYVSNALFNPKNKNLRIKKELHILNSIDGLLTTNIIKEEMETNHKIGNIPCISAIEFPEISRDSYEVETGTLIGKTVGKVQFVYAGSLYKDLRNPAFLVALFEKLPANYILAIAGINTNLLKECSNIIRDRVIDLGFIEQSEVEKLKNDADILICFNNAVKNQVPSKLFECIETGKPFINLCQLHDCPSLPYVENYQNSISVFVDDIDSDRIVEFVETHIGTTVSREEILSRYYQHTYEYVESQIEEVIANVSI